MTINPPNQTCDQPCYKYTYTKQTKIAFLLEIVPVDLGQSALQKCAPLETHDKDSRFELISITLCYS